MSSAAKIDPSEMDYYSGDSRHDAQVDEALDARSAAQDQRDPFADDVLERLARSNQDYQRSHGHYIVPLAERLLAARAESERLREALTYYAEGRYPDGGEIARDALGETDGFQDQMRRRIRPGEKASEAGHGSQGRGGVVAAGTRSCLRRVEQGAR